MNDFNLGQTMIKNFRTFLKFVRSDVTNFTIVIPASAYGGNGARYLQDLLTSISRQQVIVRVVITDHSPDMSLKRFLENGLFSNVYYFRYTFGRGNWCLNSNFALRIARFGKSDYFKIMFQDDIFIYDEALKEILEIFRKYPDKGWLCHGSDHFFDPDENINFDELSSLRRSREPNIPQFSPNLLLLQNNISCPSAVTVKNKGSLKFDRKIVLGGDCDFYWRLGLTFGDPILVKRVYTSNREHIFSITHNFQNKQIQSRKFFINGRRVRNRKDLLVWETEFIARKYKFRFPILQTLPTRIFQSSSSVVKKFYTR